MPLLLWSCATLLLKLPAWEDLETICPSFQDLGPKIFMAVMFMPFLLLPPLCYSQEFLKLAQHFLHGLWRFGRILVDLLAYAGHALLRTATGASHRASTPERLVRFV